MHRPDRRNEDSMKYPASYALLEQEELTYLEGGSLWTKAVSMFNWLYGGTLQGQFLNSIRSTAWSCLKDVSLKPVVEWGKSFWQMSWFNKATFLYGGYLVTKTTLDYLKK